MYSAKEILSTFTSGRSSAESLVLFEIQEHEDVPPTIYLGMGPNNCRDEDLCRFADSDVAAILRYENSRYEIIGRALLTN